MGRKQQDVRWPRRNSPGPFGLPELVTGSTQYGVENSELRSVGPHGMRPVQDNLASIDPAWVEATDMVWLDREGATRTSP